MNQAVDLSIHLKLAPAGQIDEVMADAPLLETTSTSLGKTVDQSTIQDLLLNGRHFTQLGTLQPGVAPITAGLSQAGGSLRDGQAYAVNGQRPESNNFLIDGADNFNNVDGGFVMEPPVDAIAEFRIFTHTAKAEFGHGTGSTLAAALGPPFIQVAGFASVGDPITGPRQSSDSNLGLNGSLTWIRGRHELKSGGGYSYDRLNTLFGIATNFGIPVNDLNSPDNVKGSIQTSQPGRLVQLALKFLL